MMQRDACEQMRNEQAMRISAVFLTCFETWKIGIEHVFGMWQDTSKMIGTYEKKHHNRDMDFYHKIKDATT